MQHWIAEENVVFVHASGARVTGRIAVAAPVVRELDCACDVVLEGLERSQTIFGASTLQALLLAVGYLGMRLHDHRSRGLKVEHVDAAGEHSGADMIATLFGPLLRAAEEPQLRKLE